MTETKEIIKFLLSRESLPLWIIILLVMIFMQESTINLHKMEIDWLKEDVQDLHFKYLDLKYR